VKISLQTATLVTVALLGLSACKKNDEKPLTMPGAPMPMDATHGVTPGAGMGMPKAAKKETQVVVPEGLKGKWKSIRVAVVDKASKKETLHVVPVGKDFLLPGTGLTLRADNLLPDFSMGDGVISSKSEKLENPAAQVRITEGGEERFKGWMFSKFPETHSFDHPKFALKLVEFIP